MNSLKLILTALLIIPAHAFAANENAEKQLPSAEPTEEPNAPQAATKSNDTRVDPSLIDKAHLHSKVEAPTWKYAAGVNMAWSIRKDYGARTLRRFEPEAIGFIYTALPWEKLWLRHGARLGYSAAQPQMPKSMRLEETDWKISAEEGLVWNSFLTPSFTGGIGYDWRTIKVKTASPVVSTDNRLNQKESFMWYYAQAGVGIPTLRGEYMIEPLLRWQHLSSDKRTNWAFGFELTKAW